MIKHQRTKLDQFFNCCKEIRPSCFQQRERWEFAEYFQGRETFYHAIYFPWVTVIFHDWLKTQSKFIQVFQDTWELFLRSMSRESWLVSCLSFLRMFVCLCYITLCWCQSHRGDQNVENGNGICKSYISLPCRPIHGPHTTHISSWESCLNISQTRHCIKESQNQNWLCQTSGKVIDLCNDILPEEKKVMGMSKGNNYSKRMRGRLLFSTFYTALSPSSWKHISNSGMFDRFGEVDWLIISAANVCP